MDANSDEPWSETDISELKNELDHGGPFASIRGVGLQGRCTNRGLLCYVRLQSARRRDEARQDQGQASHEAILEYNHTRLFRG